MRGGTPPRLTPLGDSAIIVHVGDEISEDTHLRVRAVCERLDGAPIPGLIEYVPAYTTVTVFYDAVRAARGSRTSAYELVHAALVEALGTPRSVVAADARTVDIPCCYGGDFGPDLGAVAEHAGLTPDEVVATHVGAEYLVYMIGFAPGFPYLGGLSPRIATPRRASPRITVPAGSVGIAGEQTGVYPLSTPGGWQLIGRTPLALFRPFDDPPTLLRLGDRVRFVSITAEQYAALASSVSKPAGA